MYYLLSMDQHEYLSMCLLLPLENGEQFPVLSEQRQDQLLKTM